LRLPGKLWARTASYRRRRCEARLRPKGVAATLLPFSRARRRPVSDAIGGFLFLALRLATQLIAKGIAKTGMRRAPLVAAARRPLALPLRSRDYSRRVEHLVRETMPPPDLVHANDLDTLVVARRLARRYRVPLVYDNQELYTGLHTLPRWYRAALSVQEAYLI